MKRMLTGILVVMAAVSAGVSDVQAQQARPIQAPRPPVILRPPVLVPPPPPQFKYPPPPVVPYQDDSRWKLIRQAGK